MKSIERYHLLSITAIWLLLHLFLFVHYGNRILYDSAGYLRSADFLLTHRRLEDVHLVFYSIPIFLLALFKWLFSQNVLPYLLFQVLLSGLSIIALYTASLKIFSNPWSSFFSCILFLLWIDNLQWNTVIMTESLANTTVCFLLYALAYYNGSLKSIILTIMLLAMGMFIRPTGIVIVLGTLGFLVSYYLPILKRHPMVTILLCMCVISVACSSALWMFSKWDFTEQYLKGNIITYADQVERTSLFHKGMRLGTNELILPDPQDHPLKKMFLFVVHNPIHFSASASLKIGYLISFVRPYYSFLHNLYVITWVSLIYLCFFFGYKFTPPCPLKSFALTVIVVNCCLVGISAADWDNRFYIPMEPGLVFFAGAGLVHLYHKLLLRRRSEH